MECPNAQCRKAVDPAWESCPSCKTPLPKPASLIAGDAVIQRSVIQVDQSRKEEHVHYHGEPPGKKIATETGNLCPICHVLAKDQWFLCERCQRRYICREHQDRDTFLCQPCAKAAKAEALARLGVIEPGMVLAGRYRIERLLGQGGVGEVFLATDLEFQKPFALKFLPPEMARDDDALADLRHEMEVAMELTHENILRLYHLESVGGYRFLQMEYVDGPTLAQALSAKRREQQSFSVDDLLPVLEQICEGLDYIHSKKVVHRDLKPANIMVNSQGQVKITDLGIARVIQETMTRVSNRPTTGTLVYMSPEQLQGQPLDGRSDLYGLGCLVYEMLSGRPPFHSGDLYSQHLRQSPAPLPDVPPWVNQTLLKALAKSPRDRMATAGAFFEAMTGDPWRRAQAERARQEAEAKRRLEAQEQAKRQQEAEAKRRLQAQEQAKRPDEERLRPPAPKPPDRPPARRPGSRFAAVAAALLLCLAGLSYVGFRAFGPREDRKEPDVKPPEPTITVATPPKDEPFPEAQRRPDGLQESYKHFGESQRVEPDFEQVHMDLAKTLTAGNRIDDAILHYAKALQINPSNVEAHVNSAILLSREGKLDEAETHCREALKVDPAHPDANNNLGVLLKYRGNAKEAIQYYERAAKAAPMNVGILYNLALTCHELGDFEKAKAYYSEVLRLSPGHASAQVQLSAAMKGLPLAKPAELPKAPEIQASAVPQQIDPQAVAEYNQAQALVSQGNLTEAVKHFQDAVRLSPRFPSALNNLGAVCYQLSANTSLRDGDRQKLLQDVATHFQAALQVEPNHAEAHNNLATVLMALKRYEEAISHYSDAVRLRPDYREAKENLEKAMQLRAQAQAQPAPK
jgi:serine/threonine protein kinase/Flp pilus assembly protein TadD